MRSSGHLVNLLRFFACFSLVFVQVSLAAAATKGLDAESDASNKVTVGVYANRILGLSIKENSFDIDYYLWLRWKGDRLKPHKTIELVNGTQTCEELSDDTKNGFHYITLRCVAKVTKFWDLTRFPLDSQRLELVFEDNYSGLDSLRYVADAANSAIGKSFTVSGWEVKESSAEATVGEYETNFGDPTLPDRSQSRFSRFVFGVSLVRTLADTGYALKLFFPVFIAMLIALLQFFVPVDSSLRVNLAVGSIFASVGASYAIINSLPPSQYMSMAELINITTSVAILLCLCATVYSLCLFGKRGASDSRRFDRLFVGVTAPLYAGVVALIIAGW